MGLIVDVAPVDTQERVYIQQIRGRAKNWAGTSKKNTVSFFKEHCGASAPLLYCGLNATRGIEECLQDHGIDWIEEEHE